MIEYIRANPSPEGNDGLLAIVVKHDEQRLGGFFTEPNNPLQLGLIRYPPNHEINPHVHLPRVRITEQSQEVLFVRKGSLTISIYSGNGELVKRVTLSSGDCILLMAGGHSLRTYDHTELIEIKMGPYESRDSDKVDFPTEY